jgi:hypothetical protein
MALLLALMGAASECLAADISTTNVRQPARLILEHVLAAQTGLGGEKRALRTALLVSVAIVGHLRMTTVLRTLARKAAWWRFRATW